MKVVIVEDEIRIREGIIKLLNKFYTDIDGIYEAKSGEEGLEAIRRYKPDLVITDIRMAPMDGLTMLEILIEQEKRLFKTIILSAYSDFGYAKQGIKFGVSEYLVKPVDIGEFHRAMRKVEAEIAKERLSRQENPEKLRSFEAILAGMLSGQVRYDMELGKFIENVYRISADTEIALLCVYLGKRYEEERQLAANIISAALVKGNYKDYHIVFLPHGQEVLFAVSGNIKGIERYCQFSVVREMNSSTGISAVFGFTVCTGFEKIINSVEYIHGALPWSISLGSDVMISYPKALNIQAVQLVYPINIEKDSIEALCAMDYDRMNAHAEKMLKYLTKLIYSPDMIKKALLRYLLSLLHVVKEVNFSAYEKTDEGGLLDAVAKAVTRSELEAIVFGLLEAIVRRGDKTVGLLVGKARRMVEEYYSQGVTLDKVAAALNKTPEHVSSLFVKELGVNFSTYIKNYRLNKAKELLLGTDLKLYEIAKQVGYNDAKYFSRVFKETEGVSPAEYRNNYM